MNDLNAIVSSLFYSEVKLTNKIIDIKLKSHLTTDETKILTKNLFFSKQYTGVLDAKFVISGLYPYVLHYTPNIEQQALICQQILGWIPTELHKVENCFNERC